jgi:two-component system response regulator YesN
MDPRIERVVYLIESNLSSPLGNAEMARSVGLSLSHLQHIFRDDRGETMKTYQQRLRLERANELLLSTHLSIKEIVAAVGAPDRSHFLREFTKAYGLPPKRYRMHLTSPWDTKDAEIRNKQS